MKTVTAFLLICFANFAFAEKVTCYLKLEGGSERTTAWVDKVELGENAVGGGDAGGDGPYGISKRVGELSFNMTTFDNSGELRVSVTLDDRNDEWSQLDMGKNSLRRFKGPDKMMYVLKCSAQ